MALPTQLSDVLAGPLEGATRIVVCHERRSAFRILALLELGIAILVILLTLVCIVILFALFLIATEGEAGVPGFPSLKIRFFRYWQELVIRVQDAQGNVLNEVSHVPRDAQEGDAILAAILSAADRTGIVVVETIGGEARETLAVWYGGQPLLAHLELRTSEESAEVLTRNGYTVTEGDGELLLRRVAPASSRLKAAFRVLFDLLLLPFFFWRRATWSALGEAILDLRGVEPEAWALTLYPQRRLTIHTERNGKARRHIEIDARDLLGLAWSPFLDYDRDVTRRPARLRILERGGAVHVEDAPTGSAGLALKEYVVSHACEQWEGIPSLTTRPTRCPYCGNLFVLTESTSCPSCGASPGSL